MGKAFTFEKEHPELFGGRLLSQIGIFFSDRTRDHTLFGNLSKDYYADYSKTLSLFFETVSAPIRCFLFRKRRLNISRSSSQVWL